MHPSLRTPQTPTRLAYLVWLITAYHDFYKPALAPRVVALATGAALIAEQVAAGRLAVWSTEDGTDLVGARGGATPRDSLSKDLMEWVEQEPGPLPVREWLDYLAGDAVGLYDRVADRMRAERYLVRVERPRRWRSPTYAYVPADPLIGQGPMTLMRVPLQHPSTPITLGLVWQWGMCEAVGLAHHLYDGLAPAGIERARRATADLPAPHRTLLAHLTTAVAATALT